MLDRDFKSDGRINAAAVQFIEGESTMERVGQGLAVVIVAATLLTAIPFRAIEAAPQPCAPPHRLKILELGMIPDPVRQDQRIQLWSVTLQSDYNGECLTLLEVRDRDQVAGRRVQYLIKPGVGRYTFQSEPNYRFQLQDHCFTVVVNVANAWALISPTDAQKLFCARYRAQPPPTGWSLK